MTYHIKHFAISVADLEETISWYGRVLGFEPVSRAYLDGPRSEMVTLSNGELEIEVFRHDETIAIPPERTDPDTDPQVQGMKHICFACDNLEKMIAHFKECGVDFAMGPISLGESRLCYIRDNTGNLLEFMQ